MAEHYASVYGTEKDKINCPFYVKAGACRHGERCSRVHNKPVFSQTILIQNLYQTPDQIVSSAVAQGNPPPQIPDDDRRHHFHDYYYDILDEMGKYGAIENIFVCENLAEHLAGNTYVKFTDEDAARAAREGVQERWYSGRIVRAEFSPVTDFREGKCRPFEREGFCERGDYCHFMHLYKPPQLSPTELPSAAHAPPDSDPINPPALCDDNEEQNVADAARAPPHGRVRGRELNKDEDVDLSRKSKRPREYGHPRDRNREYDRTRDREHDRDGECEPDKDRERVRERDRDRLRDRTRDREHDLERPRHWDRDHFYDRQRDRDRDRDSVRGRDRDRERDRYRERGRDRDRERDVERDRDRDRDRGYYRERDFDHKYDRDHERDTDRDRDRDRHRSRHRHRHRDPDRDRHADGDGDRSGDGNDVASGGSAPKIKTEVDVKRENELVDATSRADAASRPNGDRKDHNGDDEGRDGARDRGRGHVRDDASATSPRQKGNAGADKISPREGSYRRHRHRNGGDSDERGRAWEHERGDRRSVHDDKRRHESLERGRQAERY